MVQRVTVNDNEWQQMEMSSTTNGNEWYNEWQQWYSEWQQVTANDNLWQRVAISTNFLFFFFFRINKEPTTKYPKENSLNLREDLEEKLLN